MTDSINKISKKPFIFALVALLFILAGIVVWRTVEGNRDEVQIIQSSKFKVQSEKIASESEKSVESIKSGESDTQLQQEQVLGEEAGRLSVNDATLEELDTIPGVGAVTAQKIIDGRPWEDLEEVLKLISTRWREEARGRVKL